MTMRERAAIKVLILEVVLDVMRDVRRDSSNIGAVPWFFDRLLTSVKRVYTDAREDEARHATE